MDLNREVGEIQTRLKHIGELMDELKADIRSLLTFKWKLLGIAACTSAISSVLVTIVIELVVQKGMK